jgi:2-polyprenyl-3-methyl-5-hydroxy-6-metoxy-1,4-benzoquinol methylase
VTPDSHGPECRLCGASLVDTFVDLGPSPLCESYFATEAQARQAPRYPLHARICRQCLLVQLEAVVPARAIFDEYAYFSSYSESWVEHARRYCGQMTTRFALGPSSRIVEIASNDGYLLQYFKAQGLNVLGVEPAANVARAALAKGIPTVVDYFGCSSARTIRHDHGLADLIVANNVLAHVPDLNDFVEGLSELLAPHGTATLEFPHLLRLIENSQFDTIYHEHFSYFTLLTAQRALARHGLEVFDVEELPTHGGSVRLFVRHASGHADVESSGLEAVRAAERFTGLDQLEGHRGFASKVEIIERDLNAFLRMAKHNGKHVVGYGAPGKGNTLLNCCGVTREWLEYTVDRNPYKQGKYTPGSGIPILDPNRIAETRPDFVLILPWNLKDEIRTQMAGIREWGGRFVVPIPAVEILD